MKREVLTEYEAEKILKRYLPIAKNQLVKTIREIKLKKFPLVLKIISQQALHKSEIKGVRIVQNQEELEKNFKDLIKISKRKKLKLDGILVQEYHEGIQLIIGIKKDPVFNHVILFGAGGIYTEILRDFSIRACPISIADAESMIEDLKIKNIFYGFRGTKLNVENIKKILVSASKIPLKYKKLVEMDINPLIVNEKREKVVDARMIFEGS